MVVFVDYDHDVYVRTHEGTYQGYLQPDKPALSKLKAIDSDPPTLPDNDHSADSMHDHTKNDGSHGILNRNGFSAALSCYPYALLTDSFCQSHLGADLSFRIVKEIARQVDLNTLYALSRTCRQIHANIAPYRHQLVKQTLRCENEYVETLSDLLDGRAAIPDSVRSVLRLVSQGTLTSGRLVRGKVGRCARDMVAECRRCSRIVCRNCTIKTPTRNILKDRVRRLCTTCRTAPLAAHLTRSPSITSTSETQLPPDLSSFTASAFIHSPCSCEDMLWLCYLCGKTLRSSDTTYRRVWTWRTRYSTYLGGLGTGIGEGCQGVKCGREEDCLAAQEIELEVECEADESSPSGSPHNHHQGNARAHGHLSPQDELLRDQSLERSNSRDEEKPGYFRQEIIGIGGRVKQKAKKRVTVGACVVEYEDERDTGQYLTREEQGLNRSWCGWCCRVIPSKDDMAYPLSIL